jgi:hypothetical protein
MSRTHTPVEKFREEFNAEHPNAMEIHPCDRCGADIGTAYRIHRINFEWYCDICFERYYRNEEEEEP